jgi:hypothetical protein
MVCTGYDGDDWATRTPDGIQWHHSGTGVHVSDEVADLPEFLAEYEIVGPCPLNRWQQHATVRDA